MKILAQKHSNFAVCPEYQGLAKIVDYTALKEYEAFNDGDEPVEKFNYIVEINQIIPNSDKRFTVATKPFKPSIDERSNLYKFIKDVTGTAPTDELDQEEVIGKYVQIWTEQTLGQDGKTIYTNIKAIGKATGEVVGWTSNYIRFQDRPKKEDKRAVTRTAAPPRQYTIEEVIDEMASSVSPSLTKAKENEEMVTGISTAMSSNKKSKK